MERGVAKILITGAASGIGYWTAVKIAEYASCLILVDKNSEQLKRLKEQIPEVVTVDCVTADLSSMVELKRLIKYVKENYSHIDILINNAGGVFREFSLTAEGIDKTIATNYLSTAALCSGLLPLLKTSEYGKILNVTSDLHRFGDYDFRLFSNKPKPLIFSLHDFIARPSFWILCFLMGDYMIRSYATSKLFMVLYTIELAAQNAHTSLSINLFHLGVVKTKLALKKVNFLQSFIWQILSAFKSKSPQKAAENIVYWTCIKNDYTLSGKYFDSQKIIEPSIVVLNTAKRQRFWRETEQLLLRVL